jgi:hypothetical protein
MTNEAIEAVRTIKEFTTLLPVCVLLIVGWLFSGVSLCMQIDKDPDSKIPAIFGLIALSVGIGILLTVW